MQKRPSTAPEHAIFQKRAATVDQVPQSGPAGVNLKCHSISDGLVDLGLCEPEIKPLLSNLFNISGTGRDGKEPNQSVKVVCDDWGCTQVPVFFSLSCAVDWRDDFIRHISIHAMVKNGKASFIQPAAEALVDCGTGMEGKCIVNLQGQVPGSYISPNPDSDAHLNAMMDMVGEVGSGRVYDFNCGWSWSLDPITTLLDRSSLSQNTPKNGSGDPRECAVSACDASASAGDPIDTRTGNFNYSLVDLSLQTIGGLTTTYQYDAADRLTNVNGATYTWDDNGNLLADETHSYAYDAANRLTAVNGAGSSNTFAYDGLGNRYQSTANGQTTTYALDLAGGLSQVLSDGANTYLYGLDRLAQQNAGGISYFLPDGLGSVRQIANASGMVGQPWSFDPFGNPLGASGNNPSHYGYAGEWTDGTGLQYLRARYYAPAQGRFITQDPFPGYLNQPSTLNPYAYALNDPATLTDPSGENPFLIAGALGGLLGGAIYGYGSQVVRNLGLGICF